MFKAVAAASFVLLSSSVVLAQPACKPETPNCKPKQSSAPAKKQTSAPTKLTMDRDTQRKSDVGALQKALEAYAKKNGGSYMVKGSGSGGSGQGFIGTTYAGFPSIETALTTAGLLKIKLTDRPDGAEYMLYLCDDNRRYSISVALDRPSTAEIEQGQKKCNALGVNGTFTNYKKNYSVGN